MKADINLFLSTVNDVATETNNRGNKMKITQVLALLMLWASTASGFTTFANEAAFLANADLNCPGVIQTEGFENAPWTLVRWEDGIETAFVTNQAVTWKSNIFLDPITTSLASARSGSYGFYSRMHGEAFPLPTLFDGIRVEVDSFCAFGIWVRTTTLVTSIGMTLDDVTDTGQVVALADFGWHFVGVVEPAGFTSVDVQQISGNPGEPNHLFFDDNTVYLPEPGMAVGLMFGVLAIVTKRKGLK